MKITNYRIVWVMLGLGKYYKSQSVSNESGRKVQKVMLREQQRPGNVFQYQEKLNRRAYEPIQAQEKSYHGVTCP